MRLLGTLRVAKASGLPMRGRLTAGALTIPCALGPAGIKMRKCEGDGATPAGRFPLRQSMFRADRFKRWNAAKSIRRDDGWCDDVASGQYNRRVKLPFKPGHENLWRADQCYDVLIVLAHNQRPRTKSHGSAVFFHIAHADLRPTAGCIAIRVEDMRRLLPRLSRHCAMAIG